MKHTSSVVKTVVLHVLICCISIRSVGSQELTDISFQNQSIQDILQVLGDVSDITILTDKTVSGTASFVSPSLPPLEALYLFLEQESLYGELTDNILRVSRVSIQSVDSQSISIDANNVGIQDLVEMLSERSPIPILFNVLPRMNINFHVKDLPIQDILELILIHAPDYEIVEGDQYLLVRPLEQRASVARSGSTRGDPVVTRNGDLYSIDLENAQFKDVLAQLFDVAQIEYSFLARTDTPLSNLSFRDRSFDELLLLLMEHSQTAFTRVGDIYYIYDPRQEDILSRYNSVIYRPLEYLDVTQAVSLIPTSLASRGTVKVDEPNNAIILFGTVENLGPLQQFLDSLDVPQPSRGWIRYELNYLEPSSLQGLLPPELEMLKILNIPNTSSIIVSVSEIQEDQLMRFLEVADHPEEGRAIRLRYIKSEDLLASLPPSFDENDVSKTQDPSFIFFKGTDEKFSAFMDVLDTMDRPIPQIRYDLLVVNYQDTDGFNWEAGLSFGKSESGDTSVFSGRIVPLMDLNFDIVSTFGYQFAVKLSASLEESNSKVFADTTLNGLSGEKINFRNTNTYRYRDYRLDPTTGERVAEGSREITSGLFVDIEGWVSGDGMITMDISTTISRQLAADSDSDVLPPTTERVVNTHVRTQTGSPVIISGLTQQEEVTTIQKTPILGDIPLLGWLFKKKTTSYEDTELVIYIVPHIEYDRNDTTDNSSFFERMYTKYIREP